MTDNQNITPEVKNIPNNEKQEGKIKKYFLIAWEFIKIIVIALIIVIPIRYFIFQPFIVKGDSMIPNFHDGDYLIVDEISYKFRGIQRGDVIVLKYPLDTTQRFIKRVIGLPGETVDINNGKVSITKDGKVLNLNETYLPKNLATQGSIHITLPANKYFVMGDNRQFSYDSRMWGILPGEDIIGRALIRVFPITDTAYISEPSY